mgnify:CR=1 FL=1
MGDLHQVGKKLKYLLSQPAINSHAKNMKLKGIPELNLLRLDQRLMVIKAGHRMQVIHSMGR